MSKILLLFVTGTLMYSCSTTKKVPIGKSLLVKNEIIENDTVINDEIVASLLYQKPNSGIGKFPIGLYMYNWAKDNPDSLYYNWLNRKPNRRENLAKIISNKQVDRLSQSFLVSGLSNFLKKTGQAPVIIDSKKVERSVNRLKSYYTNRGYFDVSVKAQIDSIAAKKGKVTYAIATGKAYTIDTLEHQIETPELDSIYKQIQDKSLLKRNAIYDVDNLSAERERITKYFRNNGVYHFQVNNISYEVIDTANPYKNYKLNVITNIENRYIKNNRNLDTITREPFKIFKISGVNIFTDRTSKNKTLSIDSTTYNNYNIYSNGKLNYKPKALTNAIFIEKNDLFSDDKKALTARALSNLRIFNPPTIEYVEDTIANKNGLIANIYLVPRKKFSWVPSFDIITSNIQEFGITGSMAVSFRNLFKGAEILEISGRGNIGSSQDLANPNNLFFNISEYGGDAKLTFPRIFFPINTQSFIKKEMFPTTQFNLGFYNQQNIGLDKQSLSGGLNYNWTTNSSRNNYKFELIAVNYVQNLNVSNYFNVYKNSYNTLNSIAQNYNTDPNLVNENGNLTQEGALAFMQNVLTGQTSLTPQNEDYKATLSISERYNRLTEDNLIVSSSFQFSRSTSRGIKDKNYYNFRAKLESAGNLLSLLSKNNTASSNNTKKVFGLDFSQYIKGEVEFVKLWEVNSKSSIAFRSFGGLAVPYGNGTSIPFSRSYFAGGSNDNRGWQAYSLGPGSSKSIFDFNEANMKIALNAEYRFNFFGALDGALFTDAGNIWNIFDNVENNDLTFNGFSSLQDLAVGSGLGFRYDFSYFLFRLDFGYKTYNPARERGNRWLKDVNFGKTVLNFGINYPF
ncbi:BamA/TamA family outer membrane protein [Flavobacterium sp.]|uniref:translocation and assembly module lipoprotein TamL n=1 Tax=Flavobacterium sp. TaxID=239 RepID=UPI00352890E1